MTAPISNEMKELRKTRITLSVQAAADDIIVRMDNLERVNRSIFELNKVKESLQDGIAETMGNWIIT